MASTVQRLYLSDQFAISCGTVSVDLKRSKVLLIQSQRRVNASFSKATKTWARRLNRPQREKLSCRPEYQSNCFPWISTHQPPHRLPQRLKTAQKPPSSPSLFLSSPCEESSKLPFGMSLRLTPLLFSKRECSRRTRDSTLFGRISTRSLQFYLSVKIFGNLPRLAEKQRQHPDGYGNCCDSTPCRVC